MELTARIKTSLASAMGMQVADKPDAPVKVLGTGGGNLFVTERKCRAGRSTIAYLEIVPSAGLGASVLALWPAGENSTVIYYKSAADFRVEVEDIEHPGPVGKPIRTPAAKTEYRLGSEAQARKLYNQLKTKISSGSLYSRMLRGLGLVALWSMVAVGAILLLAPSPAAKTKASAPIAPAAAAAPQERIPSDPLATPQERAAVAGLRGVIKMGASGTPFYVFTDPNCPYCRQFERALQNVPPGFQAVIVPLGYKEGSAATTAGVLCSDDPAAEWRQAMLEQPSAALKTCERGERLMRENMAVFESMRLNRTPTMLTPAGFLVSGAATEQELAMVLGATASR